MKKKKQEKDTGFELGESKDGKKIVLAPSFFESLNAMPMTGVDKKKLLEEIKNLDFRLGTPLDPEEEKKH